MKIFHAGLPKTGTNSLAQALTILGFKVCSNPSDRQSIFLLDFAPRNVPRYQISDTCLDHLGGCDAYTDMLIASSFVDLDRLFPDSKFILTMRDLDSWLASCEKWWARGEPDREKRMIRTKMFGIPHFDRDTFIRRYAEHNESVINHFRGREEKLLILSLGANNKWDLLCEFLNKEKPDCPYPFENRQK